jgi:peptidylprolyl isomerase
MNRPTRRPRIRPPRLARSAGFALLAAASLTPALGAEPTWRPVDPDNLVFLELQEGQVVVELNPGFAPKSVAQFRRLVQEHFYDGLPFYRVIDGFVAQGGDGSDLGELSDVPLIEAEFEREWSAELPFIQVQKPDLFAPETGFVDGFAAGLDRTAETAWLLHCPGVVAMARNDSPDSSRTDFYIVIGQAPRYLDRNMNVFGRVIAGMDAVQRIRRGPADDNGIIRDDTAASRIRNITLASDLPKEDRLTAYVVDTSSDGFAELLDSRRHRTQRFFRHQPPQVLDACQVPMAGRLTR